jgi:MurNAc alpha-1-phosphate uridylyltransferase
VEGELVRSVVWPDGIVRAGERLVDSIRAGGDVTVSGRPAGRRDGRDH